MTIITAKSKTRMLTAEGVPVVNASKVGNALLLTRQNGSTITTAPVVGAQGLPGAGDFTIERGTFTPSWGVVPGTGGSVVNTGTYIFIGAGAAASQGSLTVGFQLRFGTSGQTFPTNFFSVTLPNGFIIQNHGPIYSSIVALGRGLIIPQGVSANAIHCIVYRSSNTAVGLCLLNATTGVRIDPSATVPITWAAGDAVLINCQNLMVRRP